MPNDNSASSNGDGAPAATPTPGQTDSGKKTARFQCPADFVTYCPQPCRSTLIDNLKKEEKEFWLIKAPVSFDPKCFSGFKVPLSGLQTLKVPAAEGAARSSQQIYSVLASSHCPSELHLLTSDSSSSSTVAFSPKFSGLLNVCENYGDSSGNQAPQVIPAAPAPSIPPGLKQRYQPFGSKTPCLAVSQMDGPAVPTSETFSPVAERSVRETHPEEGKQRHSKKKKKKEISIKTERGGSRVEDEDKEEEEAEMVVVKKEPVGKTQDEEMMDSSVVEEKRKKKKKKKDREREEEQGEGEQGTVIVKMEGIKVKCEPIDVLYSDTAEGSGKKKKKKRDREREREEMLEMVVDPRVIVTVEEVKDVKVKCEPTDLLSAEGSGKKKKKKKEREERMEVVEPSAIVKVEGVKIKSEFIDSVYGDAGEGSGKKKKKKRSRTDDD